MKIPVRRGHGYEVHAGAAGLPLRLCGVDLQHEKGCVAHSDGDVAVHALCDALLGAAALGDIGLHFPDTSAEFKGIDSLLLLDRCVALLAEHGWQVGQVGGTAASERAQLRPDSGRRGDGVGERLGVDGWGVSVKATTTERRGFVGREEGVEAHAVALIRAAE